MLTRALLAAALLPCACGGLLDFFKSPPSDPIPAFLAWFSSHGGSLHPNVTLSTFPEFGGRGLATTPGGSVSHHDVMFTVPASLIFTKQSIASQFPSDIESQVLSIQTDDHAIALQLMIECSLGAASKFQPYLDLLPSDVTNLPTFSDEELDYFQMPPQGVDEVNAPPPLVPPPSPLHPTHPPPPVQMRMAISDAWSSLKPLHASMASAKSVSLSPKCTSEASFKHYVAIVGSRAMVLEGAKHLTPFADMANYMPSPEQRPAGSYGQTFLTYHVLDYSSGSLSVKADRDVAASKVRCPLPFTPRARRPIRTDF